MRYVGFRMTPQKQTILFSGMIAAVPHQGGATWAVLQYLLGLQRLGHEVCFIEPLQEAALRPKNADLAASQNAKYFREVVSAFGLEKNSSLLLAGTQRTVGLPYKDLRRIARRADVVINISGMLVDAALIEPIPRRVYLDLDPAFVQLWHEVSKIDMRLDGHTHFVTVGQAIGRSGCNVPTCGRDWIPTLPPVVLDEWPARENVTRDAFTTIANWRGYGSIEYEGKHYGQKAHSLRPFFSLPTRTSEKFELALSIHPDEENDLAALKENGWQLIDPAKIAATPASYRAFVQGSKAEFGIAKSGYVVSRCGWFSDRSACYLASGCPVVAQETGFSDFLPTGEGLHAFTTIDDALANIEALTRDYKKESCDARALAGEYFDSDKVLSRLLEKTA